MREMLLHNKDEKGGDRGLIKKMREEREWRRLPGGGHQIHVLLTKC
jgi:hypothetical protein